MVIGLYIPERDITLHDTSVNFFKELETEANRELVFKFTVNSEDVSDALDMKIIKIAVKTVVVDDSRILVIQK